MAPTSSQDAAAVFDPLRQRLVRVAYPMLGSVADAEDVLQNAFLRWLDADRDAVREPEALWRRIVRQRGVHEIDSESRSAKERPNQRSPRSDLDAAFVRDADRIS